MTTENQNDRKNGKDIDAAESQWLNVELGPAVANRAQRQPPVQKPRAKARWYMEGVTQEEISSQPGMSRQARTLGALLLAAMGLLVLMVVVMIIVTFISLFT